MSNPEWTDAALTAAIRQGGAAREAALQWFYGQQRVRAAVMQQVYATGGTEHDARDVFQESLILLDRNIRQGKFEGKSTLSTYFIAIAKWQWLAMRRKQGRFVGLEHATQQEPEESPDVAVLQDELRRQLEAALAKLGQRCRELLTWYKLDYSMQEIAQKMQYENADVAKKEAHRCRAALRDILVKNKESRDSTL